jgi:cytoskeleton protein RodZ
VGAFGERFKREREKRKIALDEVAKASKIGTRMLQAIEEERFDRLPGGMFNKAFVRSYARHLGLNEDQAAADYTEIYSKLHPENPLADPEAEGRKILEQRVARVQQERPRMERIPWGKAAVAVLLVAFGFAVWGSYSRFIKSSNRAEVRKQKPTKAAQPPQPAPQVAETNTPATIQPQATQEAVETPQPAAGAFEISIKAREDSWIHITVDGKDLPDDTLAANTGKSIQANSAVVVKAGNIGAVDFWFNGQKLPAQGELDQVRTVSFGPSGLAARTAKVQAVSDPVQQ